MTRRDWLARPLRSHAPGDLREAEYLSRMLELLPGAGDELFFKAWAAAEVFLDKAKPEFILLQCGADSLAGDPITHLKYTAEAHHHTAKRLKLLAERHCGGRMLVLGGGGYNRENLAQAWTAVIEALLGERLRKIAPLSTIL